MTGPSHEPVLQLPSGLSIVDPTDRLLRFSDQEFAYYDGIPMDDPDHVMPMDVLATVAVNSFINSATRVRSVHRALAANCDGHLAQLPLSASLLDPDPPLQFVNELLHAAVQAPYVLLPAATKVLHRKRPALIPMLDNVVLGYYLKALGQASLGARTQDKRHAAGVGRIVLDAFRRDLLAVQLPIESTRKLLVSRGYALTAVRILEILVWTQVEPQGYYRTGDGL
jgi:hypothetical protein